MALPDVLFDGYSVLMALSDSQRARTSPENVSDTLDAVVRLLRSEPPIAQPASEPDYTCYDDIKLTEMILSDCGCSTTNNRSLVERVADRIARHKTASAPSEQKPVAWVTTNDDGDYAMLFFDRQEARSYSGDDEPIGLAPVSSIAPQTDYKAQRDALLDAAKRADQFITNGVALGFIRMPDADVPDPANETPGIIKAAIKLAEGDM